VTKYLKLEKNEMAVQLSKGQKISLTKEAGGTLTEIVMGLGWDVVSTKSFFGFNKLAPSIDLDASCVLLDKDKRVIDTIWFGQLRSKDGAVVHTGDNRTGDGDGDDEQINVNLKTLPMNVAAVVFTVNSFSGQTFEKIENAFCRILNKTTNTELAKYDLTGQGSHTAMIMAKVYRHNDEWKMHAIGETCVGRTWEALMPQILRAIG
jgi:tellurium resistance protein TerZ